MVHKMDRCKERLVEAKRIKIRHDPLKLYTINSGIFFVVLQWNRHKTIDIGNDYCYYKKKKTIIVIRITYQKNYWH